MKHKQQVTLVMVLILCLSSLVIGCNLDEPELPFTLSTPVAPQPIPTHFITYIDNAGFFSISYPKDWQPIALSRIQDTKTIAQKIRDGDLERAISVFSAGLVDINTPNLSINVNTTQGMRGNLSNEIKSTVKQKQKTVSEYKLISYTETTVDGRYAVIEECVANYSGTGDAVHFIHLFIVNDRTLWTITCGAELYQFNDYRADLYDIAYSFRLFE